MALIHQHINSREGGKKIIGGFSAFHSLYMWASVIGLLFIHKKLHHFFIFHFFTITHWKAKWCVYSFTLKPRNTQSRESWFVCTVLFLSAIYFRSPPPQNAVGKQTENFIIVSLICFWIAPSCIVRCASRDDFVSAMTSSFLLWLA